ncbi:hypothetical protein NOJ28_11185 [Neorhizobium galegae]|uniref:hypothetical protein n=1 Tax=Neorhizobium galegae TaxID=399 RepID=UPI0021028DD4|nr:hypothetical protein [Neorhizobium galegae]MCQ1766099.1 hypothetical protein [Neorhizobium galegae]MCQ1845013.1 hypothetical protein [Neorhizobium galegae]
MAKAAGGKEEPKRLTPKPEVLRQLYLLSGNNCAMAACKNIIIDRKGVMVGQICHIEAALPDGARFNRHQSNEERRALSNLILLCANHHLIVDSKLHEAEWTLSKVKKMKADHEARFQAIEGLLEQSFESRFVDSTTSLNPTDPGDFKELERHMPECAGTPMQVAQRKKEVAAYIKKLERMPNQEREFMLSIIKRWLRLDSGRISVSVNAHDVISAFNMTTDEVNHMGSALKRYGVGELGEIGVGWEDEWHIIIHDPYKRLSWQDIAAFCDKSGNSLDDFVLHLKFGLLA